MSKLIDSTAENTDTIRLRISTIDFLKQLGLSNYNNDKTYDGIITMLIHEYRKRVKDPFTTS
jgi:hypothetical protein